MAKRARQAAKPENTQGQDAIFPRHVGGDAELKDEAFKDQRSVRGTPNAALPAFVLGEELADLADRDPRIVVLTADLATANRTNDFRARHPDRFFDFGIAEKNMITAAAGMASCGMVSYAATFASFCAILGAEQIEDRLRLSRHEGARGRPSFRHVDGLLRHQPSRTGRPGDDAHDRRPDGGLRHRCQPAARDPARLRRSSGRHVYPARPRPRSRRSIRQVPADFRIGKAATLREGRDLTIIASGSRLRATLDAADLLAKQGIEARVIDMHTIKPLDAAAIRKAARETAAILTVEEHNVIGGLGSAVAEVLVGEERMPFQRHGIPDEFVPVGPPAALYAHYKLDAAGIARKAKAFVAAAGRR